MKIWFGLGLELRFGLVLVLDMVRVSVKVHKV